MFAHRRIQKRDLVGLKSFMSRYKSKKGYLISYDFEKECSFSGGEISILPGSFCSFGQFIGIFLLGQEPRIEGFYLTFNSIIVAEWAGKT